MEYMKTEMNKEPKKQPVDKRRITFYIDKETDEILQKRMADAGETNITAMLCRMIRENGVKPAANQGDLENRVVLLVQVCRMLMKQHEK